MRHSSNILRQAILAGALVIGIVPGVIQAASAATETVLYNFRANQGQPLGITANAKGILYGSAVTFAGGNFTGAYLFKITQAGNEQKIAALPAYAGQTALSAPVFDSKGNLYIESSQDNTYFNGYIMKRTPAGQQTIVYVFQGGKDGAHPAGGLTVGPDDTVYGSTTDGGHVYHHHVYPGGFVTDLTAGTVFKITAGGAYSQVYAFNGTALDGTHPTGHLVINAQGTLFGTTTSGGNGKCGGSSGGFFLDLGCGTLFKIDGTRKTTLHSFQDTLTDGRTPSVLTADAQGNLFGAYRNYSAIFKATEAGAVTTFYSGDPSSFSVGGTLTFDRLGNLYGVGGNTVFRVSPTGSYTLLQAFTDPSSAGRGFPAPLGSGPNDPLYVNQNGDVFGTTYLGGAYRSGLLYKIVQ